MYEMHQQMQDYVKALNHFYLEQCSPVGGGLFLGGLLIGLPTTTIPQSSDLPSAAWTSTGNELVVICNFTRSHRENYRIGVPVRRQLYREVFNSDDAAVRRDRASAIGHLSIPNPEANAWL